MSTGPVQLMAGVMAAANAAVWLLASRWERAGHGVDLRARLPAPPVISRGADLVQVAPCIAVAVWAA